MRAFTDFRTKTEFLDSGRPRQAKSDAFCGAEAQGTVWHRRCFCPVQKSNRKRGSSMKQFTFAAKSAEKSRQTSE
jgi:hypothetical protein